MRNPAFLGQIRLAQNGNGGAPAGNGGGMAPAPAPAPAPMPSPGNGMAPMAPMPNGGGAPPANGPVRMPGGGRRHRSRIIHYPRYFSPAVYFYPYSYPYSYPYVQPPAGKFICRKLEEETEEAGEDVFECEVEDSGPPVTYPVARFAGPFGWF
jgi:hypothetical protein